MAKADLITQLFKAAVANDKNNIVRVGEALIAEERHKNHHIVADRLAKIIRGGCSSPNRTGRRLENGLASLIHEIIPERRMSDLFLSKEHISLLEEIVEEHQRKELLQTYGLAARNRLMFIGKPGNGKTSLAEALAYELALPLVVVRYEGLIGSFLGETASRLNRIFEYARQSNCFLFFDEFDSIGKERGDVHETGEIKRVVSSLLLQIDSLPSRTVVAVASNHPQLLDSAAWRRFQVRIELTPPSAADKEHYLKHYQNRTGLNFGLSVKTIVQKLKVSSYAELEEFCRDVLRRAILSNTKSKAKAVTTKKLAQWESRHKTRKAKDK